MGRRGERQRTLADYLAVGLGRVPDADVARALGVTHAAPCLMRRRHGICLSPQARAEGRRRRDAARHRTGAELRAAFSAVYLSAGAGRDRDHVVAGQNLVSFFGYIGQGFVVVRLRLRARQGEPREGVGDEVLLFRGRLV